MKKLFLALFMVLVLVVSVQAEDVFSANINGVGFTIYFEPGPFSPWEQGVAEVFMNGYPVGDFPYYANDGIYIVTGLCNFRDVGGILIGFQDLDGVVFYPAGLQVPIH